MLARAIASESGVPFISLHSSALESKWWGESPKLLSAAFELARTELAPCIIFFDEIDGVGRHRSENDQSCVYSFKCELLRNMDGVDTDANAPVIVLACTNCKQSLDPALRRRFGCSIHIGNPNEDERFDILSKLVETPSATASTTVDTDNTRVDVLRKVAALSNGLSGSDLTSLYEEASMHRMQAVDIASAIKEGGILNGEDLLREMGELTWEHWELPGMLHSSNLKK